MLPDFRVLVFATVSTFVVTAAAGLFASARLLPEPMATIQPDRDTPINRIALSWQDVPRTPARELTPAALVQEAVESQPVSPQAKAEDRPQGLTPVLSAPPAANSSADETVAVKSAPSGESTPKGSDNPVSTGTIAVKPEEAPTVTAPVATPAQKQNVASRPEPAEEANRAAEPKSVSQIPPRPKASRARAEQRTIRRQPLPRRAAGPAPITPTPDANFFMDYGSRVN